MLVYFTTGSYLWETGRLLFEKAVNFEDSRWLSCRGLGGMSELGSRTLHRARRRTLAGRWPTCHSAESEGTVDMKPNRHPGQGLVSVCGCRREGVDERLGEWEEQ